MDRRDNPENPNSHSDEQFQQAYEVISLSYRGDEPERLYREAINCFDSLIEISHGNDAIREFAQRRSIDMKYLVDGASFVISKMHFNPENNYYITLGLPQHATQEELGRRWKKFMLLYHPDKQIGNEEWVSERAKKVNEAYTALKDEARRAEYDHRLAEQMLSRKIPSASSQGTMYHHRPSRAFSRLRRRESSAGWNSIRPYMTRILIAAYILIALVVLGFIYIQNRSSHLEAELAPLPANTERGEVTETASAIVPTAPAVKEHASNIVQTVPAEPIKDPVQAPRKADKTFADSPSLQTIKNWFQPQKKQAQEKAQVQAKVKEDNTSLTGKNTARVRDNAVLQPPPTEPVRREDPPPQHAEAPRAAPEHRAEPAERVNPLPEVKKQVSAQPKTEQITREEAEEFMQRYVSAYTKSDLNTFMALFSRSAVENNTLTLNEIRNAYKETFSEKINNYKIINMEIRTDGQTATVSGIYNINRYISTEDRWVRYSGKIVWRLIRENSQVRIISTNYDK